MTDTGTVGECRLPYLRLCDPDGEGDVDEAAHLPKATLEHKNHQDIIRCNRREVKGFGADPIHLQGHFRCPCRQFEVQRFARFDPQQFNTVNLDDQLAENTKKTAFAVDLDLFGGFRHVALFAKAALRQPFQARVADL